MRWLMHARVCTVTMHGEAPPTHTATGTRESVRMFLS